MATIYTVLGSSLLVEWAADQPATIYEDTGGTDQAEDGDAVAAWRSTANGTLSLLTTQSTAANRPLYRANYASSGYPAIEFDGSNDGLLIPHNAALDISEQTIFAVVKADDLTPWRFILSRHGNAGWDPGTGLLCDTSGNLTLSVGYGVNSRPVGITPGTTNRVIVAGRRAAASNEIWLNDSQIGAQNVVRSGTSHSQQGGIGNAGAVGGNYPWDGAIQHILWCSGAVSRTAIEYVINALGDRWGITITDPPSIGGGRIVHPFLQQVIG